MLKQTGKKKGFPMIRRLRLQFVAVCMLLITAVLAAVLMAVYSAAERGSERASRTVLERVLAEENALSHAGPLGPARSFDTAIRYASYSAQPRAMAPGPVWQQMFSARGSIRTNFSP